MAKTEAAKAAALIRKELKHHGIAGSVRSKNYSMGCSVRVEIENPLPATLKKVTDFCRAFQYGHFDGMTDMYEYSNTNADLPQAKHVFVSAIYSDEITQAAWDYAREKYADAANEPANFDDGLSYEGSRLHRQIINGDEGDFWRDKKPRITQGAKNVG